MRIHQARLAAIVTALGLLLIPGAALAPAVGAPAETLTGNLISTGDPAASTDGGWSWGTNAHGMILNGVTTYCAFDPQPVPNPNPATYHTVEVTSEGYQNGYGPVFATATQFQQVRWLVANHGNSARDATASAVDHAIGLLVDRATVAAGKDGSRLASPTLTQAKALVNEAQVRGHAPTLAVSAQRAANHRTATVGLSMSGLMGAVVLTLSGPAVFDANRNGQADPGEPTSWTGTDPSLVPPLAASGNGRVTISATGWAPQLWVAHHPTFQDMFFGDARPIAAQTHLDLLLAFQPVVTTAVQSAYGAKGSAIGDRVTFSAGNDPAGVPTTWIPGVAVKASGTLYGPFDKPQPTANTVPAGAPVAGRATVTASAPGTHQAGGDVVVEKSGYYTWVWSIRKAEQATGMGAYLLADYTDGYFVASETAVVRAQPEITSQVPVASAVVSKGALVSDTVIVKGATPGDLFPADWSGQPITIPLRFAVFGPYSQVEPPGTAVSGDPVLLGTTEVTNYGAKTVELGRVQHSGYYTVVWSIDTERLDATARKFIDERYHEATDLPWSPTETIEVRLAPQVITNTASYQDLDEFPAETEVIDQVEVFLPDVEDLWYQVAGEPVPVTVGTTLYGMYDVPEVQRPREATDQELAPEATIVVHEPGTYAITNPVTIPRPGFVAIGDAIHASAQVAASESDLWIRTDTNGDGVIDDQDQNNEVVSFRDRPRHWSKVQEMSADVGAHIADQLVISGFTREHGTFAGLTSSEGVLLWPADSEQIHVRVFGPVAKNPRHGPRELPNDTPILGEVWLPAENGDYWVGFEDHADAKNSDEFVVREPGYYVFVASYRSDARSHGFDSAANDPREVVHVPPPPQTPPPPVGPPPTIPLSPAAPPEPVPQAMPAVAQRLAAAGPVGGVLALGGITGFFGITALALGLLVRRLVP